MHSVRYLIRYKIAIHEFGNDSIERLHESTFSNIGIQEGETFSACCETIDVLRADSLVLSEEFGEWGRVATPD